MSSTTPLPAGHPRPTAAAIPPSSSTPRRPASIQELADRAKIKWDASRDFKYWLKVAEKARHNAQDYELHGDLENAFVEYARAATLILDKIPTHRDYSVRLTQLQRETLTSKGGGVLDRMGVLKRLLIDRHNAWENGQRTPRNQQVRPTGHESERRRRDDDRDYTPSRKPSIAVNGHRRDSKMWYPDTESERRKRNGEESPVSLQTVVGSSQVRTPQRTRAEQDAIIQRQHEADEVARAVRKAALQQQGSANGSSSLNPSGFVSIPVAPSLAQQRSLGQSSSNGTSDSSIDTPPLLPLESPMRRYDGDSTDAETEEGNDDELYKRVAELSMGSIRNRDAPSSSALVNPFGGHVPFFIQDEFALNGFSYIYSPDPPPITTTSNPPPDISAVTYPQLMTQHQRTQGYIPAYQTMPAPSFPSNSQQSSLLFENSTPLQPKNLYQNILPPTSQPVPTPADREGDYTHREKDRAYMYGPREPPPHTHRHSHSPSPRPPVPQRPYEIPQPQPQPYSYQSQPTLSVPAPSPTPASQRASPRPPSSTALPRSPAPAPVPASSSTPVSGSGTGTTLRTVSFPRAVLPRFLDIAAVNTAKNRETCGLLLGKPRASGSSRLIVTTLLIPKQHSTSDTCNMDEEELVLEFTEKRGLITLGWIHTHPTQSCFMSSVDLHTHSGFQRMLPESFAVVCAPQHTPNFGIFRLTDPPGLQTILECDQKNAFHPHPEMPIYTDADKGHVQMKDLPLEIVDLR